MNWFKTQETLLKQAVVHNDVRSLKRLLRKKCDLNQPLSERTLDWILRHKKVVCWSNPLMMSLELGSYQVALELIRAGVNLKGGYAAHQRANQKRYETPLHLILSHLNEDGMEGLEGFYKKLVCCLIAHGAPWEALNSQQLRAIDQILRVDLKTQIEQWRQEVLTKQLQHQLNEQLPHVPSDLFRTPPNLKKIKMRL